MMLDDGLVYRALYIGPNMPSLPYFLMRRDGGQVTCYPSREARNRSFFPLPKVETMPVEDYERSMTPESWQLLPGSEMEWCMARLAGEWAG